MKLVKQSVKKIFNLFGLAISRRRKVTPVLQALHIDVLFDVGANTGQHAQSTRDQGYKNKIISFEPQPDAHARLVENSRNDPAWTIHERCAVGAEKGEATINISQNSCSSSLLPMMAAHSDSAPNSIYVGKAAVKVIALDEVYSQYAQPKDRVFLKIDTQGFEKQVLEGAKESLKHLVGVQLELSIVELYKSQDLYEYFFEFFRNQGFYLWTLEPGFSNPVTGQMLQFDAIFVRKD